MHQTISCVSTPSVAGEDPHYNVSVRLSDTSGSNQTAAYEGRVEVQYRGLWGTICSNQWTINDAHVVCRSVSSNVATTAPPPSRFYCQIHTYIRAIDWNTVISDLPFTYIILGSQNCYFYTSNFVPPSTECSATLKLSALPMASRMVGLLGSSGSRRSTASATRPTSHSAASPAGASITATTGEMSMSSATVSRLESALVNVNSNRGIYLWSMYLNLQACNIM